MANQTFKDFVVECEMYDHSRENYELMKECSELLLAEKYLDDQNFIAESTPVLNSSGIALTESFFQEAGADDMIRSIMEETEQKKANILKRIWTGLVNLLKRFRMFITKLVNQLDAVGADANKALKGLREITLTREDIEAINVMQKKIWERDALTDNRVPYSTNQPFKGQLKLKYAEDAPKGDDLGLFEYYMCVALSTTQVRLLGVAADASAAKSENYIGAIPAEDLVSACKKLTRSRMPYHVSTVTSTIEGAWADVKKNGLLVNANSANVKKLVTKLEELEKAIEEQQNKEIEAQKDSNSRAGSEGFDSAAENKNAQLVAQINAAYGKVTTCVGATIRVYSQYISYRKRMVSAINGFIASHKKSS